MPSVVCLPEAPDGLVRQRRHVGRAQGPPAELVRSQQVRLALGGQLAEADRVVPGRPSSRTAARDIAPATSDTGGDRAEQRIDESLPAVVGGELGREGLEAFQETKHVHIETEIAPKEWWYPYGDGTPDRVPPDGAGA